MKATEQHLNWIELSKTALRHNVASLKKLAGDRKLAVCVKANAYGHGLDEIVKLLIKCNEVDCLTVHAVEEAAAARAAGWKRDIILLGPILKGSEEAVVEYDLQPVIFDNGALERVLSISHNVGFNVKTHIKLETGTNRQGFTEDELDAVAKVYEKYPSIGKPYAACTHFANIEDTTNHEYAQHQLDRFDLMLKKLDGLNIKPTIRHTASSAALILFDKTKFELVRPGISLYGLWPSKETYLSYQLHGGKNDLFHPVLSWKSRITQIKEIPADSFVGYGCSYKTSAPTRLAVIPTGYADGYDRKLSNLAHLLINGQRSQVRGRICMNLLMSDITHIESAKLGQSVTLLGIEKGESLTAEQLAGWAQTINYETMARISLNLPKIVVE